MADIHHELSIKASPSQVYEGVATAVGLDRWWTLRCAGEPMEGAEYTLFFGPGYDWRARVIRAETARCFELEMADSDKDWRGTRVGFDLEADGDGTILRFHHTGWPEPNAHWRVSNTCWALYLRLLKRNVEFGEVVPYEHRLDV